MARHFTAAFVFLTLLAFGFGAQARSSTYAPAPPVGPVTVTLGQSLVSLDGPWKFQVGDSPSDPAGQPLWAQPGFDDSAWETVDLTPQDGANSPTTSYVAGWEARGHTGYAGFAWYRIRVQVQGRPGENVSLAGPGNFDDAYQLFVNGAMLGGFGRFDGRRPEFFYSEPMVFPLRPAANARQAAATQVIAFRFWMSALSSFSQPDAGGLHVAPLMGTRDAVAAAYQLDWLKLVRQNAVWALTACVYSLLGLIAFCLFLLNRTDRVYLWMGVLFLLMGLGGWETALSAWTQVITVPTEFWICNVLLLPLIRFSWVMLVRSWFGLDRSTDGSTAWLPWAAGLMAAAQAVCNAGAFNMLSPLVSAAFAPLCFVGSQIFTGVFLLVNCWLIVRGIRRFGLEGWLLVPGTILAWGDWLAARLPFLHLPRMFFPFGILLSLPQIVAFLMALAMCALLVRRWVQAAQAQQRTTLELKQAQEVQQVLIPEAVPPVPGFSIQSVYQPAGQVGGDFFQSLPAKEGGVLLCIGDVSGKGMPAAMTVSLLVGTLRTLAHYTQSPGEILAAMNQRMVGRSRGGFTTCLILLAAGDGTVTVANAGHIPPYLDGREIVLENGLPLGLVGESTYAESTFHQQEQQQITLVTDGVVEARAASGELFGFERTAAIAAQSAGQICSTAQNFGQDDDITVLTLTRLAEEKLSPGPRTATILSPSIA